MHMLMSFGKLTMEFDSFYILSAHRTCLLVFTYLWISWVIHSPLRTSWRVSTIIANSRKASHSGFRWESLIFESVAPSPLSLPELGRGLLWPNLADLSGAGGTGLSSEGCAHPTLKPLSCLILWTLALLLVLILIKILLKVSHKPYQSSWWPKPQAMGGN